MQYMVQIDREINASDFFKEREKKIDWQCSFGIFFAGIDNVLGVEVNHLLEADGVDVHRYMVLSLSS